MNFFKGVKDIQEIICNRDQNFKTEKKKKEKSTTNTTETNFVAILFLKNKCSIKIYLK